MTLGTYKSKMTDKKSDWESVISASFDSGKHNMGMILSKKFVDEISSESFTDEFCNYDDYNWDFSLYHTILDKFKFVIVSLKCSRMEMLADGFAFDQIRLSDAGLLSRFRRFSLDKVVSSMERPPGDIELFCNNNESNFCNLEILTWPEGLTM